MKFESKGDFEKRNMFGRGEADSCSSAPQERVGIRKKERMLSTCMREVELR